MGNAAKGWTPERRQRQREAIGRWRPWEQSTGPVSKAGRQRAARNAFTGGHWRVFRALRQALHAQREALARVTV